MTSADRQDALVIGGGFYGCCIALHLRRELGLPRVTVVERGPRLLGRASYGNQARVHQGYHYPRDFTTAYRSKANFARFVERYRGAVDNSFLKLYAVARRNSHVTARQFERAMAAIGAPCVPASRRRTAMFSPSLVEAVFETEEFAFDADRLADMLSNDLSSAGVRVLLDTEASCVRSSDGQVDLLLSGPTGQVPATARCVVNCTYGRIARVDGVPPPVADIKYQIAELCLIEPPHELRDVGVTVMDGPFFSCMPFPARGLHSLSHVRLTPRVSWSGSAEPQRDPYDYLEAWSGQTAFHAMVRDAARLLPVISGAVHKESLFEIKAVLSGNALDDGRPILVEGVLAPGSVVSVLGGKLDNIFDVLATIDGREVLSR